MELRPLSTVFSPVPSGGLERSLSKYKEECVHWCIRPYQPSILSDMPQEEVAGSGSKQGLSKGVQLAAAADYESSYIHVRWRV